MPKENKILGLTWFNIEHVFLKIMLRYLQMSLKIMPIKHLVIKSRLIWKTFSELNWDCKKWKSLKIEIKNPKMLSTRPKRGRWEKFLDQFSNTETKIFEMWKPRNTKIFTTQTTTYLRNNQWRKEVLWLEKSYNQKSISFSRLTPLKIIEAQPRGSQIVTKLF